ncbi:MAG: hypothetical protein V4750_02725 [Pseudomonadota bacterium]
MTYSPVQAFYCGIASGASTSGSIDLSGKSFSRIGVNCVTMSTGALVTVYGAHLATDTFRPVYERVPTATVQYTLLTIPTTTSGGWATFTPPPFRYLKFITSDVVSGGVSINVCGSD